MRRQFVIYLLQGRDRGREWDENNEAIVGDWDDYYLKCL